MDITIIHGIDFWLLLFQAFKVFNNPDVENTTLISLFISVVILISIIQVTLIIILSISNKKKEAEKGGDEREKLIEAKATKISYFILSAGAWVTAFGILLTSSAFILINVLILFLVLAEIVGFSLQLIYYKRGI
ncbi:MAG: hypothetical protein H6613_07765 [Ignavibacteriales bacterium]|nr:hypothetical protein [Ignavibacteriales bacterium]